MSLIAMGTAQRVARVIAGLNVLLVAAGVALGISFSAYLDDAWHWGALLLPIDVLVYSGLALLVIARHPRHTVGWIFLFNGSLLGMVVLLNRLQPLEPAISFGPILQLAWWVSHLAFVPAFILPTSLMLLYFPDGHLPSRRWRPIAAAALLGMGCAVVSIAFVPWPREEFGIPDAHNPFAIAGSEQFFTLQFQLSGVFLVVGVVGSLLAVVARFVRSQGVERQQMKWLAYLASGGMLVVLLIAVLFRGLFAYYVFLMLPSLLAIAMAVAILRYRLYDIDLIIRRTLVYGALTLTLALVYFGSIVLLQNLVQTFTGQEQSPLVVVSSTLLIAALFTPLRRRIQGAIDRRFYRRRYDAEKTLEAFATGLRQEVNLEQISRILLSAAAESMQPEHASLWLKEE